MADDASPKSVFSSTRVVIGLGNPGDRYVGTRHNVGFDAVGRAAESLGLEWQEERSSEARWLSCAAEADNGPFLLVKPITYMNRSGDAARAIFSELYSGSNEGPLSGLDLRECLVIVDDLALPPGHLRLRAKGSDGGHNGLKSLISRLETSEFPRLRVGVGSPENVGFSTAQHVLGRPESPVERELLAAAVACATEAIILWVAREPLATLMNRFNGPVFGSRSERSDGEKSRDRDSAEADMASPDSLGSARKGNPGYDGSSSGGSVDFGSEDGPSSTDGSR